MISKSCLFLEFRLGSNLYRRYLSVSVHSKVWLNELRFLLLTRSLKIGAVSSKRIGYDAKKHWTPFPPCSSDCLLLVGSVPFSWFVRWMTCCSLIPGCSNQGVLMFWIWNSRESRSISNFKPPKTSYKPSTFCFPGCRFFAGRYIIAVHLKCGTFSQNVPQKAINHSFQYIGLILIRWYFYFQGVCCYESNRQQFLDDLNEIKSFWQFFVAFLGWLSDSFRG